MTLNNQQFEGYLFHGTNNAQDILKKGIEPSGPNTSAGTSGIFTSSRPSGARTWGADVVAMRTTRPLRIHPDIDTDPKLSQMRRQMQFSQEYFSGEPNLHEYYGPEHGDVFPLTSESAQKAVDVSEYLQNRGFDGHIDNMATTRRNEKHVVIYDPSNLTPVRMLKRRR